MEKFCKSLKKYLLVLTAAMMLIFFSAAPAFATEVAESETDAAVSEEITAQMFELAQSVKLELEKDTAVYSGSAIEVPVKRIYYVVDGQEFDADEQFVISDPKYANNINVTGSGNPAVVSVEITGYYEKNADGTYVTDQNGEKAAVYFDKTVTVEAAFRIEAEDISRVTTMELDKSEFTYNGKAQKPGILLSNKALVSGTDYSVTYTNVSGEADSCIDAGTRTVTVTGKGNYTGTLTCNFTIKPRTITADSVSLSCRKYAYNGKERKPGITVKVELSSVVTLKNKTDYTVTYSSDCTNVGTKTVAVKGKGNYTGTVKISYTVVPEKASGLKVTKRTTSALTVQCNTGKVPDCKYQFMIKEYNSSEKVWETAATKNSSSNSVTFSGLDSGRVYAVYARYYKTVDSKNYTSITWSSVLKTPVTPAKAVMSNAVKTGSKSMKVVWKAVSFGSGYEIQYSTKSDFSSSVKTVKVSGRTTTSKTISNLGSAGTYYVRVRAYVTYNDKTYRGAWSSKVSTYYSNVYASYSTTYNSDNKNRTTNLQLACKAINGKVVANGKTFSFNGTVGQRTKAKGYKEAIIYENGQEVGGIGGGICQVATTLFNASLKANFKIVERHQHSRTVHYVPLGYDAAIAWGSKDFRFTNNSGTSIKIDIHATNGTLSVKFLTNIYKKPPKVTTKVTVKNGVYTLKRYVDGKVNYTTTSDYLDD